MATIIDITREIREDMEIYPGDPKISIDRVRTHEKDGYMLSKIEMGLHTGTHIDLPVHFIEGGKGSEALPPLIGGRTLVTTKMDTSHPIVLMDRELSDADVDKVLSSNVKIVGVGTLSVGSKAVHKKLLSKGILVIEGLDLSDVDAGVYELLCMPLRLNGSEAAPARCILVKTKGDLTNLFL